MAKAKAWDRRQVEKMRALKRRPCADCGGTFPACAMDFDHRPGEDKTMSVARVAVGNRKLAAEVAKCDLVCANCHRIRTYRRKHGRDPH